MADQNNQQLVEGFKVSLSGAKLRALFFFALALRGLYWYINLYIRTNTTGEEAAYQLPGIIGMILWAMVVVFFIFRTVLGFFVTAPEGYRIAVKRFGAFRRSIGPGLGIVIPFIEKAVLVDMRKQSLDIAPENITTGDKDATGQPNPIVMKLDVIAFFEPKPDNESIRQYLFMVKDLKEMLTQIIKARLRALAGTMTFDDIKSKGKEFSEKLVETINGAIGSWGIHLIGVELQEAPPPNSVVEAMNSRRASQEKAQQTVIEAEAAAKRVVLESEANKTKRANEAEAEANFIERSVKAFGGPDNFVAVKLAESVKAGDKIVVEGLRNGIAAIVGLVTKK